MVHESLEWKRELCEKGRQLLRYNTKENFDRSFNPTCFKMERAMLYSATIIRVLIESQKLSDDVDLYRITVFKNNPAKHIDRLNRWLDEDEYDWDHTYSETVLGKNVCNWILHSYVFSFLFEENGTIIGFLVSSDYDRNKVLYTVKLDAWLNYVNFVITDDVVSLSAKFDEKRTDYLFSQKKRGDVRVKKLKNKHK